MQIGNLETLRPFLPLLENYTSKQNEAAFSTLTFWKRTRLELQRTASQAAGILFLWPAIIGWLSLVQRYRIRDLKAVRARVTELLDASETPVLICPNHLTWVDSMLVQWALFSPAAMARQPGKLAWNMPEATNFLTRTSLRALCYLTKCIPIVRGGDRARQVEALRKAAYALERGDHVMVFPEGGRTDNGRIERSRVADGVGRLVRQVDGCRVLCVYLRGDRQETSTVLPARRQTFDLTMELIEPNVERGGVRGNRIVVNQILDQLENLESTYFTEKQREHR